MTVGKSGIKESAQAIDVSCSTSFRMRHKQMAFISMMQEDDRIKGLCEIDETYIHAGRKGLVDAAAGEYYYEVFCLSAMADQIKVAYVRMPQPWSMQG